MTSTQENLLKTKKIVLEFQEYEIENILKALEQLEYKTKAFQSNWKKQENGQYWYSDTKESKRIKFIINSIKRQLSN